MCEECGCHEANQHTHNQTHKHDHDHHEHKTINLQENILAQNDRYAAQNRTSLEQKNITSLNLISSPGSGKTSLLEKTLTAVNENINTAVIVGDQETTNDAHRLKNRGAFIKQLNTHSSCHLDAHMIAHALPETVSDQTDLLIIENVGNLVCPAAFDLGERCKVALLSCTEGEDKPVKYPALFHKADLVLITKADLIEHLDWDENKCRDFIGQVNYNARVITLSALTGQGFNEWLDYLYSICKTNKS
ncbi:MAG TPA: hydrogenase nickel incorporation protein HypB [Spirochaetota bacterium]|nr:hydrogenase nickel incorporation protein HypB [Spirochaetota bacterium]